MDQNSQPQDFSQSPIPQSSPVQSSAGNSMSVTEMSRMILDLAKRLDKITSDYYLNNFPGHQDYNKSVNFNSKLKVPHFASLPATCEQGEIVESGGKLYVASAANTWTIVGTQS